MSQAFRSHGTEISKDQSNQLSNKGATGQQTVFSSVDPVTSSDPHFVPMVLLQEINNFSSNIGKKKGTLI